MSRIFGAFLLLAIFVSFLYWFIFLKQKSTSLESTVSANPYASNNNLGGITGKILIGPQCPVVVDMSGCEDKPYKALVVVKNLGGSKVGDFSSDDEGKFAKALPAGKYFLESDNNGPPSLGPTEITVEQNKYTQITLTFDTGIR